MRIRPVGAAGVKRTVGFYWVRMRCFPQYWTVGYYDGGLCPDTGDAYPWEVVGSDNIYGEDELAEVGPALVVPGPVGPS